MKKKNQKKEIDWEQRRYELAKIMLPVVLVLDNIEGTLVSSANEDLIEDYTVFWEEVVVRRVFNFVDEMLRQLKHTDPGIDKRDEEHYNHLFD